MNRFAKKVVGIGVSAITAALIVLGFAGCGKKEAGGKAGVSISFFNSKGEIQAQLEEVAERYEKQTGVRVEVLVAGAGESPYTKITSLYNSGTPPTLAMLDTTDIIALGESKAVDLSNERWIAEMADNLTRVNGRVYSFPFCVEGRGIIFNQKLIEDTLGKPFNPASINSRDALASLLQSLRAAGMENPIVISKEDWSLGAHLFAFVYESYDGTSAGADAVIDGLKAGTFDLLTYPRYGEFLATLDLLLEYNYNKKDPLGAVYERDPIHLVDGEAALWFNGCWAWPNIAEAGAAATEKWGFLPFVLGNDTGDFVNTRIQASPSKQVMIDREKASDAQIQAAKDFLNWFVYDTAGQTALVQDLALIPAAKNNAAAAPDPLGAYIREKIALGETFGPFFNTPGDHWAVVGGAMQKYIARRSSPQELAASVGAYWKAQN